MRHSSFGGQRLETTLRQELALRLTPEMRLRLEILQANMLLLEEMLQLELQQNPALDIIEGETESEPPDKSDKSEEFSLDEFYPNIPSPSYTASDENQEYQYSATTDRSNLQEHMLRVIAKEFNDSASDYRIARYILDCLDEDGFLHEAANRIAVELDVQEEQVEKVRSKIQYLEPVGIASYTIQEALLVQLRFLGYDENSVEIAILRDTFDAFLQRRVTSICHALKLAPEVVTSAFETISTLDPKPARNFRELASSCVQPDIIIQYRQGKLETAVNEGSLPPLKLSSKVREILSNPDAFKQEDVEFARRKLETARMFIKSILQRRDTLYRLGKELLLRNFDFFSGRSLRIIPLTMKDVADTLELHPSTISRAVRDKYIDSPVGIFNLRSFFTKGEQDPTLVKLKTMIADEDKNNPLTDSDIAKRLNIMGHRISRRTVAKYRLKLNIPDCFQRKALG
ncbi:RNA polymerase factor sigma-54 [candidate division WOR-3 bacterium]|nr:RNA polymerase factor sigma-54 [candidate division WOR-3 bacterium]